MELRQLRYFLMLANELHFKRAADKLFIVQPALTKQIQDLEAELGIRLFDRNKRNVKLSVAGEFFRNEVTKVFEGLEKAKNEIKQVELGQIGEVKIGYVGSCIHTFLPNLLAKLHEIFPEIHTYLSEMTSASQLLAIQKGELDISFLRNPPPNKRFQQQLVFQENFALVLPQNHWLNDTNFESMAQVSHEKFILPTKSDGEIYHQLQWSICEDAGFVPQIAHETVHGHTTLKLVESGLGISLIPISFSTVTNAAIKFIELTSIPQKAEITALWSPQNPNPSLGRFLEMI
ncbi:LysR substrate-binding domain-containing protein [Emticicia sp.]|uniref:LysR substrate-binding domain-containing protein n=1 Tax=Emticicia sp. TaxID=1930953 RepID=UPI003750D9F1